MVGERDHAKPLQSAAEALWWAARAVRRVGAPRACDSPCARIGADLGAVAAAIGPFGLMPLGNASRDVTTLDSIDRDVYDAFRALHAAGEFEWPEGELEAHRSNAQKAKKKRRRRQCNKRRLEQLNKEQPPLDVEQPTEQPAAEQQLAQQSAGEDDVPADQVRLLARARACRSVTLPLHPWSQVFAKGDRVVLLRLRKHTKLNGQTAEIDRYLSERSRWRVFVTRCPYFEGRSGFLNVRAHNLCERMPELIDRLQRRRLRH